MINAGNVIPKAGDREKVSVVSTYTPPRPQKWDEEGGDKTQRRVSIKTPGGESFTPALKVSYVVQ